MSRWSEENYKGEIDYVSKIIECFNEAKSNSYSESIIRMDVQEILNVFEKEINGDADEEWSWEVQDLEDEKRDLEIENDDLRDEIDKLEQKIETLRGKIEELTGEDWYDDECED